MSSLTPNYSLIKPGVADPTDQDLWGGYLNTDMDIIDSTMKSISDSVGSPGDTPAGAIFPYAGTTEPSNYAFCYGQAVNRVTYSTLFTNIGTVYGIGDGTTTFNLPDIRGYVVAGRNNMGGTGAGRLTGTSGGVNGDTLGAGGGTQQTTLDISQMPNHSHTLVGGVGPSAGLTYFASNNQTTVSTGSAGGGAPFNNVQPTFILNYIIKLS